MSDEQLRGLCIGRRSDRSIERKRTDSTVSIRTAARGAITRGGREPVVGRFRQRPEQAADARSSE